MNILMKKIFLLLMMMWMVKGYSQDFNPQWIAYPQVDSTSQIWFRRQIDFPQRPVYATIDVVTSGKISLFVNERNVSTALWMPSRMENDNQPVCISLDITRFLQQGSNTIAIWYAPGFEHLNEKQIAVSVVGKMKDNTKVGMKSDDQWLTHRANVTLLDEGRELLDANSYPMKWNSEDIDWATWISARMVPSQLESIKYYLSSYPAEKRSKTFIPRYFDVVGDSVYYQFDKTFRGQVRVTLRNAKRGERININGLEYVCTGETDEQACRQMTVSDNKRVLIYGDKNFKKDQIQSVEGLEIVPYIHNNYQY